ncbi:putative acetamidase [Aspergillus neoniger CBS 115656]|uniref:Amidase signature enzyme n=1 Tax=Aspergillus neoniger (strain CBS 115656) TaxID=1448310 RepID=A0A318YU57_ASPNB|nr:amidase signature enzyme [Aspergillus neoniger CBS 115656]PYH35520.1 amidase signature enzyme [Aspergillus neoniger CBS 115656]
MLTREFIDDSLYNHNYGYFSKHATIFRPGEPFYFNEIEDGPAFYRMLGQRYDEFEDQLDETNPDVARQLWHTPTELFRPYYGETIARYLVSNYKLTLYPYHDLIIYEMGAGNGTMMMNILDYIRDTDYEVYQRTKYKIIEISPSLASLQMQNLTDSLDAAGHSDRVEIINRSIFDWDTYVHSPCFFLALEVFDNFSHDQIRYDLKTELPQQGGVLIDANGEFLEYYNTQLDPIASRFLRVRQAAARRKFRTPLTSKYMKLMRSQLPWQEGHRYTLPEYIPTRLMQFFDILNTYFPGHRLIASDFDTLPDAVPGVNAPVVQTRYKRRTVPVSTPFVHQGYFDIFFPTDFNTTEDIYRAVTGKLTQYIETTIMTIPTWKSTVYKKRAAQLAAIPPSWRLPESITADPPLNALKAIRSCDILTEKELEWTEINDSTVLLSMLANREISSVQLTTAFCKRAAIAQQLTKCLTEIFFDRALSRAKELDDILENTGKVTGPLHGLPVSIKDRFDVEGFDTTVGWVGLVGKPAQSHSSIALSLESMGAVLYVKTNVPQSLMMSDSYNHVFGQSINAFNNQLISGGSSGGEGALIGTGGSVVGIGTDIGGSIRVPANLQVAGPMARSLSSIEHFMQSLLDSNPWNIDPGCIPIPWRKELAAKPTGKLRLGIVYDDGVVKPQPPIARAMREVAEKLKEAGHEVFEWDTSLHVTGQNLWTKAILADGGQHCRYLCDIVGEPLIEGMVVGTEKDELTISEREELEETKWAYQTTFLQQWTTSNIDALLMPVTPWVGYRPKSWVVSSQWLGYTALWNLLNYAAVTVPVAKVDGALDQPDQEWLEHVPRNDSDRFNWEQYDPELVKDMPITVQIVGGRFGEEKAVSVAKVLDEVLR